MTRHSVAAEAAASPLIGEGAAAVPCDDDPPSVGDMLELISAAVDNLDVFHDSDAIVEDDGLNYVAALVLQVEDITARLSVFLDQLLHEIDGVLEADTGSCDVAFFERRTYERTTWDGEGARRAIVDRITRRLAVDPQTGELHPNIVRLVEDALSMAFAAVSSAPKAPMTVTGLKALAIPVDSYRKVETTGTKITVVPR